VIAVVDVQELFVVERAVGVLRAHHALVEADVRQPQKLLGQVDHLVVQDHAIEYAALERERRQHRVRIDAERQIAGRVAVLRELLGRREEVGQRFLRQPHLVRGKEPVQDAPALLLPQAFTVVQCHGAHDVVGVVSTRRAAMTGTRAPATLLRILAPFSRSSSRGGRKLCTGAAPSANRENRTRPRLCAAGRESYAGDVGPDDISDLPN
jgi:hypothetical protein